MKTLNSKRGGGRPKKDQILVLRDSYFALKLRKRSGLNFAELERRLSPGVTFSQRSDGGGKLQPFQLSKVARGEGGLSRKTEEAVLLVDRAEEQYPGGANDFYSLFWQVCTDEQIQSRQLPDFKARVNPQLWQELCNCSDSFWSPDSVPLNFWGMELAGRQPCLDSLGMLLCHCRPYGSSDVDTDAAAYFAGKVLAKLLGRDPVLYSVSKQLLPCLEDRFPSLVPLIGEGGLDENPRDAPFDTGMRLWMAMEPRRPYGS